jgi:hypothetical protein
MAVLTARPSHNHAEAVPRAWIKVSGTASGFQARHFYFALKAFQGGNTIPRGSA